MATSSEEIMMRLGFDASAVQRGTDAMMAQQKKASTEYVGFWQSALAKRDQAEAAFNDKSIARARANLAARAALDKEFFANQAAQYEIAAGSVPANMAGGAAGAAERRGISGAEAVAIGGGSAIGVRSIGRVTRGLAETIKGVARGTVSVRGLFAVLGSSLLGYVAAIGAGVAAVTGISELFGGPGIFKTLKARRQAAESTTETQAADLNMTEMLRQRVEVMGRTGLLDKATAARYQRALRKPGQQDLMSILTATNRLMPSGGTESLLDLPEKQQLDREIAQQQIATRRSGMSATQRVTDDLTRQAQIKFQMAFQDKDSLEYRRLYLQLLAAIKQGEEDLAAVKKDQAEAAKKTADEAQRQKDLSNDLMGSEQRLAVARQQLGEQGAVYPTLGQIIQAGGAGAYDVRQLEAAKNKQIDDRLNLPASGWYFNQNRLRNEYFDRDAAIGQDEANVNFWTGRLKGSGLMKPDMQQEKLENTINSLSAKIENLKGKGAKEDPAYVIVGAVDDSP